MELELLNDNVLLQGPEIIKGLIRATVVLVAKDVAKVREGDVVLYKPNDSWVPMDYDGAEKILISAAYLVGIEKP